MVKLKDVAEKSGFSITTVSRALAGYSDVNNKTRQQIVEIAYSLGYQPNMVARQLRAQKTDTIGMIIPAYDHQLSEDFFSELLIGVGYAAAQFGYDLLISARSSGDQMDAYRCIVGGNRVDGVLVARTCRNDPRIAYLKSLNHPFVVSGRSSPDEASDFPYIDADSQLGIRMMVNHLTALGHQRLALLLPPENIAYTPYRLNGYKEGLAEASLPYRDEYIIYSNLRREGGYAAAQHLLDRHPDVTAIVASNDPMALGAMLAVHERGLQVGRDIAVTGFDDIPAAEYANPPLSTVRQPIHTIGQRLTEMLIKIIHNEPLDEPQILLTPELVIRGSCGAKGDFRKARR
ncbi:MAG: transcriptional regulator [Chloroflexota bacterium]|nr:MAG: transcriptional regulator [Chloroflexota bacterium]